MSSPLGMSQQSRRGSHLGRGHQAVRNDSSPTAIPGGRRQPKTATTGLSGVPTQPLALLSARPADYEWSAVATAQLGLKHHVAQDLEGLSRCQQAQQKIEGWTSLSSQLQERRTLKWGGPIFHYATFAGHVLGILSLKIFTDFLVIPN